MEQKYDWVDLGVVPWQQVANDLYAGHVHWISAHKLRQNDPWSWRVGIWMWGIPQYKGIDTNKWLSQMPGAQRRIWLASHNLPDDTVMKAWPTEDDADSWHVFGRKQAVPEPTADATVGRAVPPTTA